MWWSLFLSCIHEPFFPPSFCFAQGFGWRLKAWVGVGEKINNLACSIMNFSERVMDARNAIGKMKRACKRYVMA